MAYKPVWLRQVIVSKDTNDTNGTTVFHEPTDDRPKHAEYRVRNVGSADAWIGTSEDFVYTEAARLVPGGELRFECAEYVSLYARKNPSAPNADLELLVTSLPKANGFEVTPKGDE